MLDQEQHIRATVLVNPVLLVREVDTSRIPGRMINATLLYILWRIHNGHLQEDVCKFFLYMHVAYDCAERNPYGTPISLPIHSPFQMLSSSQGDPVAIPDSPQRGAWAHSYDNHRAAPSLNTNRVKSESPELSMSIREYPSSQPPQENTTFVSLTPNSSQISLDQAHQKLARNAISQTLPDSENPLEAQRPSPEGNSISHPFSNRHYHILRSVAQQRPSQTDPIETDDSLSQEHIPSDRLAKRPLGHSLPVTSITLDRAQVRSPNDSTSGQRNVQSAGLGDSSNLRTEQSAGARTQSLGTSAIHDATLSKQLSDLPVAKTATDLQGHLPTLTARREVSPDQSVQVPLLERNGAQNSQDLSLDIGSTSFNDVRASKAFTTGHFPRDSQPETTTNPTATEATSSLPTAPVRKPILDQTSYVDENPVPQLQIAGVPMNTSQDAGDTGLSGKTQLKPISGPSAKPITVADGDAQFGHELATSVKSSKKQDGDAKLKKPEQATKEAQQVSYTEVQRFERGKNTVRGENTANCTTVPSGETSQMQARPAVVNTPKKSSRATQEAVSTDGLDCKASQKLSVSRKEISGRKTAPRFENAEGNRATSGTEIGKVIVKTDRSAQEKREAEDRAKRQADAVAYLLAKEESRSRTPSSKSTSKRKRCDSNQASQSFATAASVQGVRQMSSIGTQQSSSPIVGNESFGKRSMTPLFPSGSISLVRPAKSALRKSQSSTPRSVSFNDDPIAPPGPLKTTTSKWVEPKIESRNAASGAVKDSKATSKKVIAKPKSSHTAVEQGAPTKKNLNASGSKLAPQVVKDAASTVVTGLPKPKVQTKLTITRDVKLKGRADGPPKSPTPAMKEEDTAFDGENSASTFYSDEENLPRRAKAGPSKKRKLTHAMKPTASSLDIRSEEKQQTPITVSKAEVHPPVPSAKNAHISHQNGKAQHPSYSASKPKPQAEPSSPSASDQKSIVVAVTEVDSREASKSRSPAQYISGASRASSGSASDAGPRAGHRSADESVSESGSQYESGSDSEDASESASSAETDSLMNSKGGTSLPNGVGNEKDLKSSKLQWETSNKPSNRKTLSASSRSVSQSRTGEEDKENPSRDLDQQLQRDAHLSMKPPRQETRVQSATKTGKPAPVPVVEPGVSQFPTLTGLRGRALKTDDYAGATATQSSKAPLLSRIVSKPVKQLETQAADDTSSSSSESEDETSSSDDQQSKPNGQSSRENADETTKPQPRRIPGSRGIMKRMFSGGVTDT